MFTTHHLDEDVVLFPWVERNCGERGKRAVEKLSEEHDSLSEKEKFILERSKEIKAGEKKIFFSNDLEKFRDVYIQYAIFEENEIIPTLSRASKTEIQILVNTLRERGSSHPKGKFALALFRDAAVSNPRDRAEWDKKMPWVLRSIVIPAMSVMSQSYSQYYSLVS